jgi:hypothetical protein
MTCLLHLTLASPSIVGEPAVISTLFRPKVVVLEWAAPVTDGTPVWRTNLAR